VTSARNVLARLWADLGNDPAALDQVDLTGSEPALPSSFAVGTAMQASVAASALAAAEVWRARTGKAQRVGVDMRAAAIASRSERYLNINGGRRPSCGTRSPARINAVTAAGCACTPTFRIIATAC
jgi:crotonobetainyl-CoA:carnitine CoA-transferase CaiB-like acyl-CoA transferase